MKKFLGLLLTSLAVISLASCKVDKKSSDSKDDETSNIIPSSSDANTSSEDISSSNVETYYHVTFVNYDDSLLYEVDVKEGEEALYRGETPTRPEDDEFTYEFVGWDKDLTSITEDVTTMAEYNYTAKTDWGPLIPF